MFSFFNKSVTANSGVAYDYKFNSIDGGQIKLSDYKDKVIVIVNEQVDVDILHNMRIFNHYIIITKIKI